MGKFADLALQIEDNLFTFTAPKIVEIKNWKLAVLHRLCICGVAMYIVVYQILLGNQYMKQYPVQAVFKLELQQPRRLQGLKDWWVANQCSSTSNACRYVVKRFEDMPYCCSAACTFNNSADPTVCTCPWTVPGLKAIRPCIYEDFMSRGNTLWPNRIFVETYRTRFFQTLNTTCQKMNGCDRAWMNARNSDRFYIAGVEDYYVKLEHFVTQSDLQFATSSSDMNGALWVEGTGEVEQKLCANPPAGVAYKVHPDVSKETTNTPPCFLPPDFFLPGLDGMRPTVNNSDVFFMRTLVGAAGYDFDASGFRANGGSLTLSVNYGNAYGILPGTGPPVFGEKPPFYFYRIEGSFDDGTRDQSVSYTSLDSRFYEIAYGLSLSMTGQGSIGAFDFLTLTMVTITGAALTGIAAVITNNVALSFLAHSRYYKRILKERLVPLEGEENLRDLPEKELDSILETWSLPKTGDRETKIIKIIEAQHFHPDGPCKEQGEVETPRIVVEPADREETEPTPRLVREYLDVLQVVHTSASGALTSRSSASGGFTSRSSARTNASSARSRSPAAPPDPEDMARSLREFSRDFVSSGGEMEFPATEARVRAPRVRSRDAPKGHFRSGRDP